MLLPYTVNFSHGSEQQSVPDATKPPFQIQPGQIDTTTTSLNLPGKGRVDYGELYNENLVHLMENFSSPTPPTMPTRGQLWYNTSSNPPALMLYTIDRTTDGQYPGWLQVMTTGANDRFHIPVVPSYALVVGPVKGDVVIQDSDSTLYLYDGVNWRAVATQLWAQTALTIDGGTAAFV
jgi:hypothetical protein